MVAVPLSSARSALVRERVLSGVQSLLEQGEELTFANISRAASIPERTLYRHFPNRELLMSAVFDWANQRLGFRGELPSDAAGLAGLARQVFPGFDRITAIVRQLLFTPEGRSARLANKSQRQRAMLALVRREAPELNGADSRRVAAVLQVLTAAATWHALAEYWDLDGAQAAEAVILASELIFEGARARTAKNGRPGQGARAKRRPRKESAR